MVETAVFRTRMLPAGTLGQLLLTAGTAGIAVVVAASLLLPPLVTGVVALGVLGALAVLARRRVVDAEYRVGPEGLSERLTPVTGAAPHERRWGWDAIRSYRLDREATSSLAGRNVLVIRLPAHRLQLREPVEPDERDAHARFVDRFVGYATGDVAPGGPGDSSGPRAEQPHRQPLASGQAPQLRRTMTHQAVRRPSVMRPPSLLERPTGRVLAGLGALALFGLVLAAVMLGATLGPWFRFAFVLLPGALWLASRALRSPDQ